MAEWKPHVDSMHLARPPNLRERGVPPWIHLPAPVIVQISQEVEQLAVLELHCLRMSGRLQRGDHVRVCVRDPRPTVNGESRDAGGGVMRHMSGRRHMPERAMARHTKW